MFPTSQDQAQSNAFGTSTLAPLSTDALLPQPSTAPGLTDTNQFSLKIGSSAPTAAGVGNTLTPILTPVIVPDFITPIYLTDNSLGTATNLGSLSSTITRSGSVSSSDTIDYFRVNLAGAGSSLNITLTGMTADADLQLIRDYNGNGIVDSGDAIASSNRSGNSDESINLHGLAAGSYFIGVKRFSGDTSYTLRLSPDFKSNLLATENNVGTLTGTRTFINPSYNEGESFDRRNGISSTDTSDYYRFSIGSIRNVSLGLTGIGAGADLDMRLIRDYNNNGVIDAGEEIANSNHSSNWNEAINKNLEAGNYFVQVNRFSGASNYSLKMSETAPQVRFTVNQVIAIDNPDSGWFGDNADYYARISVNGATTTTGVISNSNNISPNWQFTQNVNSRYVNIEVQLWDSDGGLAGADDHIDIDTGSGFRNLDLTYDLITNQITGDVSGLGGRRLFTSGTGDSDRASMYFTVDSGDWYNMNLRDAGTIDLTRSFAADGALDRKDMIAILRDTKDGSVIDSTEVTDLKRVVSDLGYMMPGYVKNLAGKAVNGDAANPRSGIGNLFAGSSSTQMENLIGKWFLGNDRPDAAASSTYRYVSGSLFQGGANINDIVQGGVGDCYFVAALASVADNKVGYINNMFIDNGDNTYTVKFFRNGVADYVTVDRYLPVNAGGNSVYAGWNGGSYTETNNELWVALAEKAYAQLNESGWIGQNNTNTYAGIAGGLAYLPMQHLTGLAASNPGTSANKADIIAKVGSDNLVSFGRQGHAYAVTSYTAATGKFHLHNPWGHSHLDLTWAQLQSTASSGWHFTST